MKDGQETIHLSEIPFIAVCGADEPNQRTTPHRLNVNCQCCLGNHVWIGQQMGGSPVDETSYEWVEYCKVCGKENTED